MRVWHARSASVAGGLAWLIASSSAFGQGASIEAPSALSSPNGQAGPADGGAVLVKGAWSSASDAVTPVPEAGQVRPGSYVNAYFGLTYPLPAHWGQKYEGPPPSDSGYYVLAQLSSPESRTTAGRATLVILAHDLFFTPTPANSALELVNDTRDHLAAGYSIEQPPIRVTIGGRTFIRFAFGAPATGLHWYMLATEIRCHIVQWVYTSSDTALLEKLVRGFNGLTLAADADVPVCVKDYASAQNVLARVEPVFPERRFNPIPVRVIIDTEGEVKHMHFLSAFPSESQALMVALAQWRFKPYMRDGHAVEVETGIVFGGAPRTVASGR